jgi:DNA-binding transcriptional ArsR family regulator
MIRYRFGHDDLLRTRFAISPLFEATASVAALRDPARHSIHLPWVRAVRPRLAGFGGLALLDALVGADGGYSPDFVAPPPASPLPDVRAEVERVARTPAAQVRRELEWLHPDGPPPVLRPLLDRPRRGLERLAAVLLEYWARAIEPFWEDLRGVLEDDIAHRARLLTAGGPIEVFADLHPDARWADGGLLVDRPAAADVDLGGRGLQLVPSAFIWPRAGAMVDPPWQPALLYPPRGVGLLWAPRRDAGSGLARLLGARRAAVLAALDREQTTTALARRLGASPAGVSEHLAVLRDAGLLRARREGRQVLYARTAAGDVLLRAGVT